MILTGVIFILLVSMLILGLLADNIMNPIILISIWLFVVFATVTLGSYYNNSIDIGIIKAQHKRIAVYNENIKELNSRLNSLKVDKTALLNHDSPVSSLVVSISSAMEKLAEVKIIKANAQVNIVKRNEFIFSFLVSKEALKLALEQPTTEEEK